jgi:predicted nucleotidyltransferase
MNQAKLFLRDKDKQKLLDLLDEYLPTVQAWAYGSRVNGEAHDASDLDLVLRTADLSPIPVGQLVNFLDALRESTLPIMVEARDWARLPPSFHQQILKKYVVLKDCR